MGNHKAANFIQQCMVNYILPQHRYPRHNIASSDQLIFNSVHLKLQPTHTRDLGVHAHSYKNVNKDQRQELSPFQVYICFNLHLE